MDALVSQEFEEFRVLKINRRRSNVIVSRRVLLEEERDARRQDLCAPWRKARLCKGKAKNITEYGVFVDLGGLDGLLHITDTRGWKRIRHPREMIQMGQDLTLKVLSFDRENNKVSLGLKQLVPDPWQDIQARFPEGARTSRARLPILSITAPLSSLNPAWKALCIFPKCPGPGSCAIHPRWCIPAMRWKLSSWGGWRQKAHQPRHEAGSSQSWELVAERYPEGTILEGALSRTLPNSACSSASRMALTV